MLVYVASFTAYVVLLNLTKIYDFRDMSTPTDKKKLQQFLGLTAFLSPFKPNLADNAVVLRDLRKEDNMFTREQHHHCFDSLKHLVTTESNLQYFCVSRTPTLQTDASLRGLGAALLQERVSGVLHPVQRCSRIECLVCFIRCSFAPGESVWCASSGAALLQDRVPGVLHPVQLCSRRECLVCFTRCSFAPR